MKLTPLVNYIEEDWAVIKPVLKVATASCFVIAAFLFIGGCFARGKVDAAKINTLVSSNAFLTGQYEGQIKTTKQMEEKVEKDERRFNAELTQTKMDAHEVARSKDVEIVRLETEKASAQQRLSYFESLPGHILNLYTNLAGQNDPTNRQQLLTVVNAIDSLTNSINFLTSMRPDFDLYLNQQKVTNGCSISIGPSRKLEIAVLNIGGETAEHLRITLKSSDHFQSTNLIATEWKFNGFISFFINEQTHRFENLESR